MNKYKVLWFDDECNELNSFIDDAADFGIDLVGYSNADDGIEELNANYLQYDAIILDGLFYSNKNQTGEVSTTIGFGKTVKAIEKLQVQGVILPCFVLSGQSSIHTANDTVIELFKDSHSENHKFFEKNDEDFKCLCNEIIKACKDKNNTIIRHKYQKVFDAIDSHFSESDTAKYLLKILKAIEQPNVDFDDSLYFTEIRIIIEHVFRKSNKIGLLHDKCLLNAKVNLTESCLFLSGEPTKHLGVKCKKAHFTRLMADSVKSLLYITGAGAHTTDPQFENNINLHEYRKTIQTPYLLFSLTFQLMDVIIWFADYMKNNADYGINKYQWETIEATDGTWIHGVIGEKQENGWSSFISPSKQKVGVPPSFVKSKNLKEGDKVRVVTKPSPDGEKTFIDNIEKL